MCSGSSAAFAQLEQSAPASPPDPTTETPQAGPAAGSVEVGDIIVTAQRREQSLLKVPQAVTALSTESLERKGISNTAELAVGVPNLQVNSYSGATQPNFTLRGVGISNEYNSNQASPVGVYLNDVYVASRVSQGMALFDLERVEVLRGPQGTLFGRNTTGGAINIITAAPKLSGSKGYLTAGYGNFNTFKIQGAAEADLVQDQLGIRLALNYEKGDGMFKNVSPVGRDPGSTDILTGRATLLFRPADSPLEVKIVGYGGRARPTQAPIFALSQFRTGLGFFEVNMDRVGAQNTSSYGASIKASYELGEGLSLISLTSYDGGALDIELNCDGGTGLTCFLPWKSKFKQFSEEVRVNLSSDSLQLVAGLYYGSDLNTTDNLFYFGNVGFAQQYDQHRQSYAAFAQADINLTDQLVLTLGGRYTIDRAQYKNGTAYLFSGGLGDPQTPLFTTVPCPGPIGSCPYDPSSRYNVSGGNKAPTGRVALSYTFDSGTLAYASFSRGYRAGAFNGGGYTSSAGITYIDPEFVDAYEAGIKGRFLDRRLTLSLASFLYMYKNQQQVDTRPGPVSVLINAPKSRLYGIEGEASYRVSNSLDLNGSIGFLNSKYQDLTLQGVILSGNVLPYAPPITFDAGFDWKLAQIGGGDLTLSPNVSYSGKRFFSSFNDINPPGGPERNEELHQDASAKLNASITWARENLRLRLWGHNLTNSKVLGYGLDFRGAGFPFNYTVPEPPRTYGIEARVSF